MKFKYEQLPLFCHYCGMLGHDVKNCAEHFSVTKNGGMMDFQYGDFLKAIGGRPRVDSFVGKQRGLEYSSKGGGEEVPIRSEALLQWNRAITTEEGQCRNSRINEEGQSKFLGTMPQV